MADEMDETGPFCKGSVHPVVVEDALPDLLVVCLKHGANIYRGILLDSMKRELPYGVNFSMNALKKEYEVPVKGSAGSESAVTPSNQPEMSASVHRHTYTMDFKSGSTQLLPQPKRDFSRPLRDKNIRNMRLRPRQVLCSKCKQGIHDTQVQNQTGAAAKPPAPPVAETPEPPKQQERYETRKRKQMMTLKPPSAPVVEPQKVRKVDKTVNTSKSSPIIKISFAGPRGQGNVVEIPSKPNIPSDSEDGKNTPTVEEDDQNMNHEEYRKLRKAQKKAEKRIKISGVDTDAESVTSEARSHSSTVGPKRKKSKRAKHKHVKRKHKHRTGKRHNSGQSEGNESFKENATEAELSLTGIVVNEDDGSNGGDDIVIYTNEPDDSDSHPNSPSNTPSKFRDQNEDSEDRDGIVVLSPRHNIMIDCDNIKIGTPTSKQYDSNTETSQELDLDFSNMAEDFFGSNKTSPSGSDTENNLSDVPFDVTQNDQENLDDYNGDFTNGDEHDSFGPLMMRIQNRHVSKVILEDDRIIRNGDIIWGKIHGFPWWPGRVVTITESLKDSGVIINQTAQISWFASSTMSHMACSELYPFLQDFKLRYNKKKKGSYKLAVKQATFAAHTAAAEHQNMTPELDHVVDMEVDILDP